MKKTGSRRKALRPTASRLARGSPQEEQPPLGAVDGDLPDELIEALRIQLLPDGADARLARLPLLQLLVELLLEVDHVQARGRRARNVLHPQLPALRPLAGGKDGVQDVLRLRRTLRTSE